MRLSESPTEEQSPLVSSFDMAVAGPSSIGLDAPGPSKAHVPNANGFHTNGTSNGAGLALNMNAANGIVAKNGKSPVARVNLPGTLLYEDGDIEREEFVRLVIQSLRDVGYSCALPTFSV